MSRGLWMEAFVSEYSELQPPSGEQCGGDQAEDIRVSGTAGKGGCGLSWHGC